MNFKNKVIAIVGPTGVGKTETSLKLAKRTNSEIISCDSMQIYKGMDIGTDKVSKAAMITVPHHLIDIKDPKESYSVCEYANDAKIKADEIFEREKNVMVVGGTGLYVDSFIKGTDFSAATGSEEIRKELGEFAQKNGNDALHKILEQIDAESAEAIHSNNTKRVIRAIEYFRLTGEKISYHNKKTAMVPSPYDYVYIGLTRNRDELYDRIDKRVDAMMEKGLLDEVFNLYKNGCTRKMTSMQALGYKELICYIEGRCTLCEAVRIIKRDSRRYAKRQLTWFNRNKEIFWINLSEITSAEDATMACLNHIERNFS